VEHVRLDLRVEHACGKDEKREAQSSNGAYGKPSVGAREVIRLGREEAVWVECAGHAG